MNIFTKSSIAAISCGSGTVPGAQVSNKNENRCMPSLTGSKGIKRRSFKMTTSHSLGPSPKSTELRWL